MAAFFIAGFIGGVFRGIVGLTKYMTSYKDVEIRPWYFGGMVVLSGIIGLTTAWVVQDLGIQILGIEELTPAIALIVGYGGGDLIENLYKIAVQRENIFSR